MARPSRISRSGSLSDFSLGRVIGGSGVCINMESGERGRAACAYTNSRRSAGGPLINRGLYKFISDACGCDPNDDYSSDDGQFIFLIDKQGSELAYRNQRALAALRRHAEYLQSYQRNLYERSVSGPRLKFVGFRVFISLILFIVHGRLTCGEVIGVTGAKVVLNCRPELLRNV